MNTQLEDKVAVVSGGARGMGAAHCREIVARGGKVVIGDVLDDEGQALADEIGEGSVYVHLDVTSASDWAAAVDTAVSRFGKLNVLVNNAGVLSHGAVGEYDQAQWDRTIAINLTGQFLGITAARDALVESAPSSIVNISSTNGFQGSAGMHGYTASKFGVRGLTKSVAMELGPLGVRANSVHPGAITTPMIEGLDVAKFAFALKRYGQPSEVSTLVCYLASDESSFSTGSEFIVDGGQLAGYSD
jgi:3alpha(or 20beta)-hydroxysteroid dehydrogenase